MDPSLDFLVEMARGAGAILREGYGKAHTIQRKGRIDLVTEMDHRSEAYLIEAIRSRFPGHTIDSEESGLITGAEQALWLIDPLDGTTNYAHDIPQFSVSIAFASAGVVQLGVVYDPMRDDCFTAARGQGAFHNGVPLHVSDTSEFSRSLLVTGFPYEPGPNGEDNIAHFAHFTRLTQGVRRFGSAALDLCYVAAGRFDGYWELTIKAWDIAAGALMVEEAGGKVTKISGDARYLEAPHTILAGNPMIYKKLLKEMAALA
jgi:myo-inositol-1(or 4)-monophosphatase